MNAHKFPRLQK